MTLPRLGVVIVTYNSSDVILDCLESLLASEGAALSIAVVDNASGDGTLEHIRSWAAGQAAYSAPDGLPFALAAAPKPIALGPMAEGPASEQGHGIDLIDAGANGGFAAGVNLGLRHLRGDPGLDRFWILNPDSMVPPDTACALAEMPAPPGGFSLMGGRVIYLDETCDTIQIDGGVIDRRTGVTRNVNQYASASRTPPPDVAKLDFITGASMVASRAFLDRAGLLPEDYFLYFEEVEWALRRGYLPLAYCPDARVYHHGGTAIGSVVPGRIASPFSLYYLHRSRLRFVRRNLWRALPGAVAYSIAKAGRIALSGHWKAAAAVLAGSFSGLTSRLPRH